MFFADVNAQSVMVIITSGAVLVRIASDWQRLKTIQENMVTKASLAEELKKLDEQFLTRREWNQFKETL